MYLLKQKIEDFIVEEIPKFELDNSGEYAYFWLKKKGYNTTAALQMIAEKLNIHIRNIGFAGAKDKNAITKQVISVRYINKDKAKKITGFKNLELEYIGNGKEQISLGGLEGNRFIVEVRNLDSKEIKSPNIKKIPNYYGPQRFSSDNIEIGKLIIQKQFQKALKLVNDKDVQSYLEEKPADIAGALRTIHLKQRQMYVHAYQSYIWNEVVKRYLKTNPYKNEKIPIVGYSTKVPDSPLGHIIKDVFDKEGIIQRDFIIKQIPEISSAGNERDLFLEVDKIKMIIQEDELNKGKFKAHLEFTLPRGSYATVLIDYLFNPKFPEMQIKTEKEIEKIEEDSGI